MFSVSLVGLSLRACRVRGILNAALIPGKLAIDNASLQVAHLLGAVTPGGEALPETRLLRHRIPLPCLDVDNY